MLMLSWDNVNHAHHLSLASLINTDQLCRPELRLVLLVFLLDSWGASSSINWWDLSVKTKVVDRLSFLTVQHSKKWLFRLKCNIISLVRLLFLWLKTVWTQSYIQIHSTEFNSIYLNSLYRADLHRVHMPALKRFRLRETECKAVWG